MKKTAILFSGLFPKQLVSKVMNVNYWNLGSYFVEVNIVHVYSTAQKIVIR